MAEKTVEDGEDEKLAEDPVKDSGAAIGSKTVDEALVRPGTGTTLGKATIGSKTADEALVRPGTGTTLTGH